MAKNVFKSEAQKEWLKKNKPDVYEQILKETGEGEDLPEKLVDGKPAKRSPIANG